MKIIKSLLFILLVMFVLLGIFVAGIAAGTYYILSPAGGDKPVRVKVSQGDSAAVVGRNLQNVGAIRSALAFRAAAKFTGAGADLKPGEYLVDPNQNVSQILEQLKKGYNTLRMVTIPEGLTVKQIGEVLEKNGVVSGEEFMRTAREKTFMLGGKSLKSLEGYLLPETYDLPESYKADEVIQCFLDAFERRVVPAYERKKESLPYPLSLHQVVILASMVEREAQIPEERPVIARVYYNRLKRGMNMECDATIQYALGKQKEVLKYSDLQIDSPYNTYKYAGLPPGPIANPGIDSILAVLEPANADYIFYVRNDVKNDGSHIFSKTFQEHNAAIRKYQK